MTLSSLLVNLVIIFLTLVVVGFVLSVLTQLAKKKHESIEPSHVGDEEKTPKVEHKKSEFLATNNEKKFYFALQRALTDKYVIHSQVSLMALVQPVEFKNNSRKGILV